MGLCHPVKESVFVYIVSYIGLETALCIIHVHIYEM